LYSLESFEKKIVSVRGIQRLKEWLILGGTEGLLAVNLNTNENKWLENFYVYGFVNNEFTNEYFASTTEGLVALNLDENGNPKSKLTYPNNDNGMIGVLFLDSKSFLFGGIYEGLYKYHDLKAEKLAIKPFNNLGIANVKSIAYHEPYYWISTHKGLFMLNKELEIEYYFSKENGLSDEFVYGTVKDKDNFVWCSTNNGLNKIDATTKQVWNFNTQHGLPAKEFNTNAFFTRFNGNVLFGSVDGFVEFSSVQHAELNSKQSISIHSLVANNSSLLIQHDRLGNEIIHLNADQRFFKASVQTIHYINPQSALISYFLEGVDTDWQRGKGLQNISYFNLKPNTYKLYLSNDQRLGIPNESSSSSLRVILIQVDGYFWEYWWGKVLLYSLGVVLLVCFVVWSYRQKLAKKQIELEEQLRLENERNRIAKDLHDDLGTGLTQIMMLNEISMHQLRKQNFTTDLLMQTSEISRNLVSNMNDLIWVLKPEKESLEEVVATLREKLTRIFENSTLQFNFTANIEESKQVVNSVLRRNMLLLLKELSNNSLKHAAAKTVLVHISSRDNRINIDYSDDGKGFNLEEVAEKGNGLRSIQNRVEQFQGILVMNSKPDKGVQVHIEIPQKQ